MKDPAYLSLRQAAKLWPHTGKPPHSSKLLRAILNGKESRQRPGESIKLRAVHNGGGWVTTAEWIHDYVTALTADRGGRAPVDKVEDRAKEARSRLAAAGW